MAFRKFMVLHLTRPLLSCKGILLNVGENFSHQGIFTTEPQSSQRLSIFFSLCPPCLRGEYSKISSYWSDLGVPFDVAQDMLCAFAAVIVSPISLPSP
jgi:hypothetical protein